ncbi:MAG: ABC transporter permease [Verrucomicrobia bacterium]|nr:ABC transporter permease [Verrucomicrobiota bacterium]
MKLSKTKEANIGSTISHVVSVWSLLILLVALIVAFSIIKPDTFPTYFNFRSILNNKSVQALLALAVFLPMTANHFDLSVGYLLGISQVLVIGLQGQGLNWPEASGIVLLLGAAVGLANGILVTAVGIDSFIATLGTGTLLYGFNEWYTGGQQVVATLPESFTNISGAFLGVPLPAIYVLVLSVSLWVAFEYLPVGRYLYVLGASPRAAELNGISAKRYVTGAFLATGIISAFAGIVLQSQLQVGQSSVGPEYLLPAFTAALLGATSVRPGRVNVWGTILAVAVIAIAVAGLNQLGAPFFVEPIFDGAMLILAVGLAVTTARRRSKLSNTAPGVPGAASALPTNE